MLAVAHHPPPTEKRQVPREIIIDGELEIVEGPLCVGRPVCPDIKDFPRGRVRIWETLWTKFRRERGSRPEEIAIFRAPVPPREGMILVRRKRIDFSGL